MQILRKSSTFVPQKKYYTMKELKERILNLATITRLNPDNTMDVEGKSCVYARAVMYRESVRFVLTCDICDLR